MKSHFLKFAGITSLLMSVFAIAPYEAKAECSDKILCMTYQQKFEKALEQSSEGAPLLVMDFAAFNAWEDIVKETESLRQTVAEDFEAYNKYRVTYQAENMPSDVVLTDPQPDDPGTTSNNSKPAMGGGGGPSVNVMELSNAMQLDDSSFADLKLRGIMEDEYRIAATETSSDAIVGDSMEFSYSKVMDNYFRGIAKTDVRKIASHFINKFLKEPCDNVNATSNFDMRRLMLYREALKEAAGLGYYAQVQSLDWAELLDDFQADINKYAVGDASDINKVERVNYLLRQFLNKLFAVLVQTRSSQLELVSVKKMYHDKVMLRKITMEYAKELAEEIAANNGEEG